MQLTLTEAYPNCGEWRINALWSVHQGQYQIWYDTENLASASYYLDDVPNDVHLSWVTMYGHGKTKKRLYKGGKLT